MKPLDRVVQASAAASAADAELRAAVGDAVQAGIPLARVARAAGVGRETVYRWLRDAG